MSRIVSILRAAHCRSTHHYFAIDALRRIETAQGCRLRDLLLKYYGDYLAGAKAPDTSFKDFKNHVLHVDDNNWGGAPRACEQWLATAIEHLDNRRWKKAAYACGVLSHYFTDPIMPLHTGQSDRESVVHRPMEWSVYKAYEAICQLGDADQLRVNFQLANSTDWISQAVLAAAKLAHAHSARLLEIYDPAQASISASLGLNDEARRIFSELFGVAMAGWASILSRVADETTAEIPQTSLSLTTLLATIDTPLAWIVLKISNTAEQRAVSAILKEYAASGTVRKNLPREVRVVQQERAKSSAKPPASTPAVSSDSAATTVPPSTGQPYQIPDLERPPLPSVAATVPEPVIDDPRPENGLAFNVRVVNCDSPQEPEPASSAENPRIQQAPQSGTRPASKWFLNDELRRQRRISFQSSIVDAPSIGPKTAQRFESIGIMTVEQFVAADAEKMVRQLESRWITVDLLKNWQDQARLVCEVPILCGYKAQLLVAVECRNSQQLAQCTVLELHQRLSNFCLSTEAERILRSSSPPSSTEVARWISAARDGHLKLAS